MLSVLELSTGGVPLCASAKTQVENFELAPVGKLLKCKSLVVLRQHYSAKT